MILIIDKKNPKLLQTFNNDPYANIAIQCKNNIVLKLSLSHLSIDSQYFDRVDMDCHSINLSHLPDKPLMKVLRSLYGDQLRANSVKELWELYEIIEFLQIQDYKQNIKQYIESHPSLMDELQLLEFCYQNNLLKDQIKQYHFEKKLSMLSESRNYLKLEKLSDATVNNLLIQYYERYQDDEDCFQIINSVLENYFGRNQIKPYQYFSVQAVNQIPGLANLQAIWEKFHHSISYLLSARDTIKQSQFINNNNPGTGSNPYSQSYGSISVAGGFANQPHNYQSSLHMTTIGSLSQKKNSLFGFNNTPRTTAFISYGGQQTHRHNYMSNSAIGSNYSSQLAKKDAEIAELQRNLELKKQIILSLKAEIQNASEEQGKIQTSSRRLYHPNLPINTPKLSSKFGSITGQALLQSISDEEEDSFIENFRKQNTNMVLENEQDDFMVQPVSIGAFKKNSESQLKSTARISTRRIFH